MVENEISVAEAARTLGVAMSYLYSLVWSGKLPARKIGGVWRIPVAAVEARREARAD